MESESKRRAFLQKSGCRSFAGLKQMNAWRCFAEYAVKIPLWSTKCQLLINTTVESTGKLLKTADHLTNGQTKRGAATATEHCYYYYHLFIFFLAFHNAKHGCPMG